MTLLEFRAAIERLPTSTPIADMLHTSGYASHKDHWLNWLREYNGPGHYGRRDSGRTPAFVYKRLQCPEMIIWLAEAVGITENTIRTALTKCRSVRNSSARCGKLRMYISWGMISERMERKPVHEGA